MTKFFSTVVCENWVNVFDLQYKADVSSQMYVPNKDFIAISIIKINVLPSYEIIDKKVMLQW